MKKLENLKKHILDNKETNVYFINNNQYFLELVNLVFNNPHTFFRQLNRHGFYKNKKFYAPKFTHLKTWIEQVTPKLSNNIYKISTKISWIFYNLTDFPKCTNSNCENFNKYYGINLNLNAFTTYSKYCSKKCTYSSTELHESIKQTNLKIYGVTCVLALQENILKTQQYIDDNFDKIILRIRKQYTYNNIHFNSLPELALYIWLTDNNIKFEYQPKNKKLLYVDIKNKQHKYYPDFYLIGCNLLIEIKGDNHFDKITGKMINISDRSKDYIAEAKYQCMIENNVVIYKQDKYSQFIEYCNKKYGGRNKFRRMFKNDSN